MGANVIKGAGVGFVGEKPKPPKEKQGGGELLLLVALFNIQVNTRQILSCLEEIKASDDPLIVEKMIKEIELCEEELSVYFGPLSRSVRGAIRDGLGDFSVISRKCIDMGLV